MRQGVAIFAAAAIVAATLPFLREHDDAIVGLLNKAKIAVGVSSAQASGEKGVVDPPALTDIEIAQLDDRRDIITAPAHGKRTAELTLDPEYQRAADTILRRGNVYEGAIVMSDVRTGKVLAWASYNRGRPRDIATEVAWPSASIFKIVTGAALVEAGVPLSQEHCFDPRSGGEHGILQKHLEPDEERDTECATLGIAMGRSLNIVFARLAQKHLNQDVLKGAATRLGYGIEVPFDLPVPPSTVEMPDDQLEFARAAAGFWHTFLSPFQGMNLAQTIANKGEMIKSWVVDRVVDENDVELYKAPGTRQPLRRVLDERTAWAVTQMMLQTVDNGTSFKTFHDRAGRPFLPNISVAGKTGTLTKNDPETLITWWVGFAPADAPEVALSVLVLNRGPWRIKGTHAAADMLRIYFADQGRKGVQFPQGFSGRKRRKETLENTTDLEPRPAASSAASANEVSE
jgi:cell division protein FtsI/penicillin-binding protein 2